jgi:phospholipid/cholesterol/gamma-HCH transport system permease protein
MAQAEASIRAYREGGDLVLSADGRWVLATAGRIAREVEAVEPPAASAVGGVRIDLARIEALDTAGAVMVRALERRLASAGAPVEVRGGEERYAALLDAVRGDEAATAGPEPKAHPVIEMVERTGRMSVALLTEGRDLLNFLGIVTIAAGRTLASPRRFRGTAFVAQLEKTGLDALPIVGLLSFLIGIVLAFQGADQLARFGAELFVVNLLGVSVLREIGILMTSIIVAGRSGSAFTAQIGTMKVNQEVDALRTLGLEPVELLVLPRVFALMVALPFLAFYADVMALLGGALMSRFALDIPFGLFLHQLRSSVDLTILLVGLSKAPVFAFTIALVGCYEGLKVSGSAESVGRLTTQSVVVSIFLVIVLDAVFSVFFSLLGL